MIRTATVVEPGGEGHSPRVNNDAISSAKAASSRRFWGVRERDYRVANPQSLALSSGDTVELYLPPGRTLASAALTFLLPLALFPVGCILAGRIVSSTAAAVKSVTTEAVTFFLGFGFLLAGIPLGALLRRLIRGFRDLPEIVRVISPSEAAACGEKHPDDCGGCTFCG